MDSNITPSISPLFFAIESLEGLSNKLELPSKKRKISDNRSIPKVEEKDLHEPPEPGYYEPNSPRSPSPPPPSSSSSNPPHSSSSPRQISSSNSPLVPPPSSSNPLPPLPPPPSQNVNQNSGNNGNNGSNRNNGNHGSHSNHSNNNENGNENNNNNVDTPDENKSESAGGGGDISSYVSNFLAGREGADALLALTDHLQKEYKARKEESIQQANKSNQEALTKPTTSTAIISPSSEGKQNFLDITEYLNMPQNEAARRLQIPTSTLSKRWKEAAVNRKWPYRTVSKIEKEIMTLLHNIPQQSKGSSAPLPPEIQASLGKLLKKRQEELRSVIIRL